MSGRVGDDEGDMGADTRHSCAEGQQVVRRRVGAAHVMVVAAPLRHVGGGGGEVGRRDDADDSRGGERIGALDGTQRAAAATRVDKGSAQLAWRARVGRVHRLARRLQPGRELGHRHRDGCE